MGEIYQCATKLPNGHKIYHITLIYSKWQLHIPTFSIPWPPKIYPNWDFWFEKLPSGNPEAVHKVFMLQTTFQPERPHMHVQVCFPSLVLCRRQCDQKCF
jgi:hypothetical protein